MRNMKSFLIIPAAIMMAAAVSCNVLEDRTDCPVWIKFAEDFNPHSVDGKMYFSSHEGGSALTQRYDAQTGDFISRNVRPYVQKGRSEISFIEGLESMSFQNDSLVTIPYGSDCDEVYAARDLVDTYSEEWVVRDSLCKQFARVTLHMVSKAGEKYPYSLRVRGNVNGFYSRSFQPAEGRFYCTPEMKADGTCSFRLPRQMDDSVYLEVWGKEHGLYNEPDSVLGVILLGGYIASSGYNWNKHCLDDIDLTLDFVAGKVTVIVDDWTVGFDLVVKI